MRAQRKIIKRCLQFRIAHIEVWLLKRRRAYKEKLLDVQKLRHRDVQKLRHSIVTIDGIYYLNRSEPKQNQKTKNKNTLVTLTEKNIRLESEEIISKWKGKHGISKSWKSKEIASQRKESMELAKPGNRKKSDHKENESMELENPGNRKQWAHKEKESWK